MTGSVPVDYVSIAPTRFAPAALATLPRKRGRDKKLHRDGGMKFGSKEPSDGMNLRKKRAAFSKETARRRTI